MSSYRITRNPDGSLTYDWGDGRRTVTTPPTCSICHQPADNHTLTATITIDADNGDTATWRHAHCDTDTP